jgi:hypothetical protein
MTKFSLKLTLILSVASNAALAAQGIPLGPFKVLPAVEVTLKYDDNVTIASGTGVNKEDKEESSFVTVLRPQVGLLMQQQGQSYLVTLGTEIGRYFDSSDDNYEDIFLEGKANWKIVRFTEFSLGAHYNRGHDSRGSTDRGILNEVETWDSMGVTGLFQYGQKERIGFDAEIGYITKEYDEFIFAVKLDDYDQTNFTGRVYYQVLPKTRLFFEAHYNIIEYKETTNARSDSDASNYSVGVIWNITRKTTGTAQIGYLKKEFDSSDFEEFSDISWKIALDWKPMHRSTVNFYTGRYTNETTGIGDYLETQDMSVNWTHKWMDRLSTKVGVYLAQTDFPGGIREDLNKVDRSDDVINLDLGVSYKVLKWGSITAGVSLTERDSNVDTDDYDRNIYYVTFKAVY